LRYGLEFGSFEAVQEKRTSLNLTPEKPLKFAEGFSLSFNISFRSVAQYNFGYVFRILGANNKHIDLLVSPEKLSVVSSDDKFIAECNLEEITNNFTLFFPFSLTLDAKSKQLSITIGDLYFSQQLTDANDFKEVYIVFGRCNHPQFLSSDVPKATIKDLRINSIKGKALYYWKLSKHTDSGVYDELTNRFAKVDNPRWLINDHALWNKRVSFFTLKNPQITYNTNRKIIAIADRSVFYTFNTNTYRLNSFPTNSGMVHSNQPNQIIYNPIDSTYYSYCFLFLDGRDIAAYNARNRSWDNDNVVEYGLLFWHHNRFFSPTENSVYFFGGYGQHKYTNQVNKFSFTDKVWGKYQLTGDPFYPRYLSGLGKINDNKVLIFGGFGSKSGLQSLSPMNFYDLYEIDIPELRVKKIWELKQPEQHFAVANSMVVDTVNRCFYALCFPQHQYETAFTLYKFSMDRPEYEPVSNNIPFYFNDILSYADLFLNEETNELFAITFSSLNTDSLSTVSIYSLSYPPVAETIVEQIVNKKEPFNIYAIIAGILVIIITSALYFSIKKRKKKKRKAKKIFSDEDITKNPLTDRIKRQAIYLFGGFQVYDKNRRKVTGEFAPMLKQLFLIMLLTTLKEDSKGISSTKLSEILWPDKSYESARNNRAVLISKIRQIFDNIGAMRIENENSYWKIRLGDEIYCDYKEAIELFSQLKDAKNRSKENILHLVDIVSYGELLPNVQIEWVDTFKSAFANSLIDVLVETSRQKELQFSATEIISIADAIFIHDPLNDDALKLKCTALVKMGKNGMAVTTYNSFVKEYTTLFCQNYNYSFDQIVS
jgi:two-component SAPR family response regulator